MIRSREEPATVEKARLASAERFSAFAFNRTQRASTVSGTSYPLGRLS